MQIFNIQVLDYLGFTSKMSFVGTLITVPDSRHNTFYVRQYAVCSTCLRNGIPVNIMVHFVEKQMRERTLV